MGTRVGFGPREPNFVPDPAGSYTVPLNKYFGKYTLDNVLAEMSSQGDDGADEHTTNIRSGG